MYEPIEIAWRDAEHWSGYSAALGLYVCWEREKLRFYAPRRGGICGRCLRRRNGGLRRPGTEAQAEAEAEGRRAEAQADDEAELRRQADEARRQADARAAELDARLAELQRPDDARA